MSSFKSQNIFLILLVIVAGRATYFGFDWQSGLSMLILGGLYVGMQLYREFLVTKEKVMSENEFRAKVISEIESIKGQIGTVKLAQMQSNKSIKHSMQF